MRYLATLLAIALTVSGCSMSTGTVTGGKTELKRSSEKRTTIRIYTPSEVKP